LFNRAYESIMATAAAHLVTNFKGARSPLYFVSSGIRLKVAELKVDGKSVSCKLTGELVRYPKPEMVSTSLTGGAKADGGKPDTLVGACLEGAVEGMMKKVVPEMRKQARP
jgi:hypothetical protein